MQYEILYSPSYSLTRVRLNQGESIIVESGAMVSMSDDILIDTNAKGGILKSLGRAVLGGESFFLNTFTAGHEGEVTFAPSLPGDIFAVQMTNKTIYVQSGSFLACTDGIEVNTKWGGAKTFFSSEGFFLIELKGTGVAFIASYGAIHEIELKVDEKYKVDTGHMVSFDASINYRVMKVGGWKSTILSGEGLVCELTGPGRITLQTRSEQSLLSWLIPKLPKRE